MTGQFEEYRKLNQLFSSHNSILLAVSGGIDSMVMLHLFIKANYNISVAHCNFRLRGAESDEDERFIEELCRTHNLRFYKKRFHTTKYASDKGISIQMAARDLRYEWLRQVRKEDDIDLLATGHNLNDNAETILINMSRGTGISGLTGIKSKSAYIIRPVLFASRQMIREYADQNSITFREDSSNIQTKYTRNKIRHKIIPVLEQINPSVIHSIGQTSEYLSSAFTIYEQAVTSKIGEIVSRENNKSCIELKHIKNLEPLDTWIYEIFKQWNFGRLQVKDIIRLTDAATGKQLFSSTHILTRDRNRIIITGRYNDERKIFTLHSLDDLRSCPLTESALIIPAEEFHILKDPDYACLDADLVMFPLTLRLWEDGDYFHPLGMDGKKKISDLLIDLKIPVPEKKDVFVLETGGRIAWVLGIRTDNRFKVTDSTREVLLIRKKQI
mgnify:CR=1 FL=1